MTLITSCPSCGTMFRVVPDQLKISEGWVRCGHCSEVFDAAAHLSDESVLGNLPEAQGTMSGELREDLPLPPPPAAPPPPARLPPLRREKAAVAADAPTRPAALPAKASSPAPLRGSDKDKSSDPSDFFGEDSEAALEPSPLDAPFVFRRSEISLRDMPDPEPGGESQMLPEDFELDEPEPVPNVSFVRQARRRAFWRRPGVRLLLTLLLLLLAGVLAGQMAYQDRDRLAQERPALRPALEILCDALGCTLAAPRQIESIVIDSSGFNRLRNDTYRLSFTLRNSASFAVAAPAMELTVTDAQDQTLIRRVITPAELGAPNHQIPAAGEWSRTVGVVLDTGGPARIAGYRLLAFYP